MNADEVKAALLERPEEVCRHLFPSGKLKGNHWRVGNLDGDPGESLSISLENGSYFDHATRDSGGNLLELWRKSRHLTFSEALNACREWLGVPAVSFAPRIKRLEPSEATFSWESEVLPLTDAQSKKLAELRGYDKMFVAELSKAGLIGFHETKQAIAFPVRDSSGAIVGAHLFAPERNRNPYFTPKGIKASCFVIGDLESAEEIHAHESQWDMLADMEESSYPHGSKRVAFVSTRGASNGAKVGALVREGQRVVFVMQNDEEKKGRVAAEDWLADAVASLPSGVEALRVDLPKQFEDLQAMRQQTGSFDKFVELFDTARANAKTIKKREFPEPQTPKLPQLPKPPLETDKEPSLGSLGSLGFRGCAETEFPLELFPESLASVAREVARVGMVPESMAAATVLGVASASLGAGIRVETYGGKHTRGNLFLLIVAESGTGKDSSMSLAAAPLYEIEREWLKRWIEETRPNLLGDLRAVQFEIDQAKKSAAKETEAAKSTVSEAATREEFRRLERKKASIEEQLEAEPALTVADVTKEALSSVMAGQNLEAVASISAESRGVVNVLLGRYANGQSDEDVYCGGFSGTPIKVNRRSRETLNLSNPCLGALWMIQPDAFGELLKNPKMVESGLMPRFLFFDSRAEPAQIPDHLPEFLPAVRAEWERLIRSLVARYRLAEEVETVRPTPDAWCLLRDFDNELRRQRTTGGGLKDVAKFAARWPEIAWRVALIFHAAEHGDTAHDCELAEETASRAVEVVRWFAGQCLGLLAMGRHARRQARLELLLRLLRGGEITLRDLSKSHGFESSEVESLAKGCALFEVEERQNPNGGPLSRVAKLKPKD